MAVADKVKGIIVEQLGVDEEEVTPDASFVETSAQTPSTRVEPVMKCSKRSGSRSRRGCREDHAVKEAVDIESYSRSSAVLAQAEPRTPASRRRRGLPHMRRTERESSRRSVGPRVPLA